MGGAAPVTGRVLKSGVNMNVDPSAGSEIKRLQDGSELPALIGNAPCDLKVSFGTAGVPLMRPVIVKAVYQQGMEAVR
jgi:hypothetical protein